MSTLKQIIQLHRQGAGIKRIARSLGISKNTVRKYLRRIETDTLTLTASEEVLVECLSRPSNPTQDRYEHFQGLLPYLEKELQKTGVTRQLLWQEYKQQYPDGYNHTQFCHYLRLRKHSQQVSMVQDQKAGDRLYIDFAGKRLEVVDPSSGEVSLVEVFVAVLGSSQYTYVEAIRSQTKADFLRATENALHFFGGVPQAIVPDNLKAAVTKASKYEPLLNQTFEEFAHHYRTVILLARSRKPQDKALVERTVTLVYQRIYARLRNEVFLTLRSLNDAIKERLPYLNEACFQGRPDSRADLFTELDRPALRPLPLHRYEWKYYKGVTVLKNYHVFLKEDHHYYSVPYRYMSKKVKVAYTGSSVEVYYQHERIAVHTRSPCEYQYSTLKEHMPSAHRFVWDWCPEKFIRWAARISPVVEEYIRKVLASKAHPEQGYKSCMGILNFEKKVGRERLVAACQRGLDFQSYGYQVIKNIKMRQMRLLGMAQAFQTSMESRQAEKFTPDEWMSYLIEAEWEDRQQRKVQRYTTTARFRYPASVERIDFDYPRHLDKNYLLRLANGQFLDKRESIIITGSTGVGKSFIASALGHQACQLGYRVLYFNTAKLSTQLKASKADGSYLKEMNRIEKHDLLILDDFGLAPLDTNSRLMLLEIMEDRHGRRSTLITSQLPVSQWYEVLAEPTVADAILDRLVHTAHRIELSGESMRKKQKGEEKTES